MPERLYTFKSGAREDLSALNNEYTLSDIVTLIKGGVDCGGDFAMQNIKHGKLIIKLKGKSIVGITMAHLDKFARHYLFKCDVCFDSHQIEVGDQCEFCGGVGCSDCKEGLIFKTIACPNCTGKQALGDSDEWINRIRIERAQSHGNGRPIPRQTRRGARRKTRQRN